MNRTPGNPPPPPPRWFLWLPVVAIAVWWPVAPSWQSDDFLALHYAQDFGRVLADFHGPQYGATDIWLFYRPLITLSFWIDGVLGAADPFVAHLSNVLAHGASTLLVGLLWRRFLPDGLALLAAVLWSAMPSHAGSIAWAVGRVDSHTTVWCLLCLWAFVRRCERTRAAAPAPAAPMLLLFAAALASKELAFVVPPLATMLGCLLAPPGGNAGRIRFALRAALPLWLLFGGYLGWRWFVLGRFGGYLATHYDPAAMLRGLASIVADLCVPARWAHAEGLGPAWLTGGRTTLVWFTVAALVLPAATWLRAPRRLLVAAGMFVVAAAPMAGFFAGADNVHSLRYFYLPSIVLAGMVAAAGRTAALLWLLASVVPLAAMRGTQLAADRQSAAMHRAVLAAAERGAASPMFVAGLPHSNPQGSVVQLHFGVDRMLLPPFFRGDVQLFALRPLAESAGAVRLLPADAPPFALPLGSTWSFADAATLQPVAAAEAPLPVLRIEGDESGVLDISPARLADLAANHRRYWDTGTPSFGLRTPGVKPVGFRVTIFTANGYLSALCFDHGLGGEHDGTIDMLRFFAGGKDRVPPPALVAMQPDLFIGDALTVPTTIDVTPEFPVLIEAGAMQGSTFVPSHRAQRLLTFRFDRSYPAWVRAVQGGAR